MRQPRAGDRKLDNGGGPCRPARSLFIGGRDGQDKAKLAVNGNVRVDWPLGRRTRDPKNSHHFSRLGLEVELDIAEEMSKMRTVVTSCVNRRRCSPVWRSLWALLRIPGGSPCLCQASCRGEAALDCFPRAMARIAGTLWAIFARVSWVGASHASNSPECRRFPAVGRKIGVTRKSTPQRRSQYTF
jgi:hypothetical protein